MIYHLVLPDYWQKFSENEDYLPETFAQEGFIHLSTESQVAGVLSRYYPGVPRLFKLHVDEANLSAALKYEPATGGELFPHLYGPLDRAAVVQVEEITQPLVVGLVLFPNLTQLDLTGPYEVLARMPGVTMHLVAEHLDPVAAGSGPLRLLPSTTFADCPALDVLLVPGGPGVDALLTDAPLLDFLQKQGAQARYVTSVCTGSLLLAAAGLLCGYRATTHWLSLDLLREFPGVEVVGERVVRDRNRLTGGGVTAGIDFALTLVADLYGAQRAQAIQLLLEYHPQPPFAAGHPSVADPALVAAERAARHDAHQTRAEGVRQAVETLFGT